MVKKAHFITGKGGVGKSLISAVLARSLSHSNAKTLLTELNDNTFYQDYLKLKRISYKPTSWIKGVDVAQWSPQDCLKEYALHLLKIESLYKLFFENPVSRSLIQVAPGLEELALLGKITSSPRSHGPSMNYDQLVIDSFSTGHFMSLFKAPAAMAEAIQFGPMGEQSRGIDQWIRDPDFTHIHIVTIAEELPITETIELYKEIQSEFKLKPHVYLNKLTGLEKADLENLKDDVREAMMTLIENEKNAVEELNVNKIRFVELPLVASLDPDVLIEELSDLILKKKVSL